ncbi:Fpg/Nei family DNA glycosylase [Paenibacillus paeoniae]|uniref:Formamidopyrimidine-DNA glycosylase n=1 Tax=Paenibacillus paeoniae TaxID=2292705 RepID=A0A371PLN1_9BACL|nr:DNA-formamidopyrimidine glycosylase family protein [Paenibacillus paeoniae]REK77120.1 Fpg/Nei family DNA glycosylase [Paenibacillus paeoniae]
MQELPELDIYRAMLAERYAGALITAMTIHQQEMDEAVKIELGEHVVGTTIWFVERRAQHLVFHLDNGKRLLAYVPNEAHAYCGYGEEEPDATASVTFRFGERYLTFYGLQRDDLKLMSVKGLEAYMKGRGIDPLDKRLTLARFVNRFAKKRSTLKTALMDEGLLSGIGVVYADEIAFAARIRPDAKLASLDDDAWESLYHAMGSVLRDSISHGGAGDKPFFEGDILTGGFAERLQVYRRDGEACSRCGGTIQKITAGNRKSFACTACQENCE